MDYDVIIIGAGVAGMTAAIYARRAGKTVLVLEGGIYGGQIVNTFNIQNWPGEPGVSGVDLSKKIYHQMHDLGVEIEMDEVLSVEKTSDGDEFTVKTEDEKYSAGAIILAVGTEDKKLGLKGEAKFIGRGVSYCATCDGAFYKSKNVAVIGGGNTAFYDALYLADIVEKVYLVHRRDEFRADASLVEKVRMKKNVEFALGYVPEEILGDKKVTGIDLTPSGKVKTVTKKMELEVDGVFVAVGKKPKTEKFNDLVELDSEDYIVADESCQTSCAGVFTAGDCRTKTIRQLVTAAGDGAVAAEAAVKYLS